METTNQHSSMWQRSTTRRFLRWLVRWRTLRRATVAIACLATIIALFYAEENWRGKRAWLTFKNRMEAKGEHFDPASVAPKPVPPDKNFAMTPLLRPLLDYTIVNGTNVWRDPEGVQRAKAVHTSIPGRPGEKPPSLQGGWAAGKFTDLTAWQAFYRNNTNYPAPAQPGTPAADVLVALSRFDNELAELRTAATRRYCVFPVRYEGEEPGLEHLVVLRNLAWLPALRASALLELDRSDAALADIELTLKLAEAPKNEPLLISQLVRLAMLQMAIQPLWEGLAQHRWNDIQLATLQSRFENMNPLEGYLLAIRGENIIFIGQVFDRLRTGQYSMSTLTANGTEQASWLERFLPRAIPKGWFYQNQLVCSRLLLQHYLSAVDIQRQCIDLQALKEAATAMHRLEATRTPYNIIAQNLIPPFNPIVMKFAYGQCAVDLAEVACALERYHLAYGEYPETLDVLTPQFIAKVPQDVIACEPLKYRRTNDGRFVLYSVGWNQIDDGGKVALAKSGGIQIDAGDWVWQYPAR